MDASMGCWRDEERRWEMEGVGGSGDESVRRGRARKGRDRVKRYIVTESFGVSRLRKEEE